MGGVHWQAGKLVRTATVCKCTLHIWGMMQRQSTFVNSDIFSQLGSHSARYLGRG